MLKGPPADDPNRTAQYWPQFRVLFLANVLEPLIEEKASAKRHIDELECEASAAAGSGRSQRGPEVAWAGLYVHCLDGPA